MKKMGLDWIATNHDWTIGCEWIWVGLIASCLDSGNTNKLVLTCLNRFFTLDVCSTMVSPTLKVIYQESGIWY